MTSSTYLLDEITEKDLIDFIIKIFYTTIPVYKVSLVYSVRINDDKNTLYQLENIYEAAYFLDQFQLVVRIHIVPSKGGVIEKDNGQYFNEKYFYTIGDKNEEDLETLKQDIVYYHNESIYYLTKLSSNNISITCNVYTMDDLLEEKKRGEKGNV